MTNIILICVTNLLFLICGYYLGNKREVITIQKGDTVQKLTHYVDADEEASYVTPEMEIEYERQLWEKSFGGGE